MIDESVIAKTELSMRTTTVIIQIVCVAIGSVFLWAAISFSGDASVGGAMLGSMMFLFASLLGADHTTNTSTSSRQLFKILAVLSGAPVIVIGVFGLMKLAQASHWGDFLGLLARLVLFCTLLLAVAFDQKPLVQRTVRRFGITTPKKD
jgi:hypothetical protein